MHELGIVMQVIDQVEKAAEENAVSKVLKLRTVNLRLEHFYKHGCQKFFL